MNNPTYKVSHSAEVGRQFRVAMDRAEDAGKLDAALAAAKQLMAILAVSPYDLGESREEFPDIGIQIRVGFVSSFVVYFGLHEDAKTVFIRSIEWR
jgi:hypothetical protein